MLRDLCPAEWSKAMNRNFTKSESTLSTVPIPRNTFEPFVSADAVACYVGIERRQSDAINPRWKTARVPSRSGGQAQSLAVQAQRS